ncbi:hypothetical protein [Embleya scabrispora]|uniref:hypothetical protein n=1 Tax=Embleya scabrispora TaxID=159449 RepID=UPI00037BBCA8|nr:hypothetical protein [Embleya scabrispora]MYS87599.1 hypothetical protein [Streptomyces sp. SID5474]
MTDIRFTAIDPDRPVVRDRINEIITVPLLLCDAAAAPVGRINLLLDGVRAELLHASLTRALEGPAPMRRPG